MWYIVITFQYNSFENFAGNGKKVFADSFCGVMQYVYNIIPPNKAASSTLPMWESFSSTSMLDGFNWELPVKSSVSSSPDSTNYK